MRSRDRAQIGRRSRRSTAACSAWPVMRVSSCWRSAQPNQRPIRAQPCLEEETGRMLTPPFSFDEIMAPLGAERFFAEYEGRRPLHLKGAADKFAAVMSWARLNDLLGMATIWSQASLQLVLDKEPIAEPRATARRRRAATAARCCGPIPTRSSAFLAARRDAGRQRHRPSERRADRLRAGDGAGARRQGPGQPLSVVAAPAGLRRPFRHPRRLRGARRGHQDLACLRRPGAGPDRASDVPDPAARASREGAGRAS